MFARALDRIDGRHKTREKRSIRNYHASLTIAVNISVAIRPRDKILDAAECGLRLAVCIYCLHLPRCIACLRTQMHRCTDVVSLPRTRTIDDEPYFSPALPPSPDLSTVSFPRAEERDGKVDPCLGFYVIVHARDVNISSFAYRARDATICIPLSFSLLLPAPILPFSLP